jgi:hypothetical protein
MALVIVAGSFVLDVRCRSDRGMRRPSRPGGGVGLCPHCMPPLPPRPCHIAAPSVTEPRQAYDYPVDRPADISTIVKNGAGVGKVGL